MLNDCIIRTERITLLEVPTTDPESMIRTYEDTDGGLCLQVRRRAVISSGTKKRNIMAHAVLSPGQALVLRNALTQFLGHPRRFSPVGETSNSGCRTDTFKFEIRTDNPQQAYDMAHLMAIVGNLYGGACCVDGALVAGPWPDLPGSKLSPEAEELSTALRALFED